MNIIYFYGIIAFFAAATLLIACLRLKKIGKEGDKEPDSDENVFPKPTQKYIFRNPAGNIVMEIPITPTESGIYFAALCAKKETEANPLYQIAIVPYGSTDYNNADWCEWDALDNHFSLIIEKDDTKSN